MDWSLSKKDEQESCLLFVTDCLLFHYCFENGLVLVCFRAFAKQGRVETSKYKKCPWTNVAIQIY